MKRASRMRHVAALLPLALALALAGCSQDMSDLKRFVARTKERPGGHVQPIPEFEPYKSFTYDPSKLRDPFEPQKGFALTEEQKQEKKQSKGLAPNTDRRREPLESYPLDSLKMVGTMSQDGKRFGLVRDPDGTIHRVRPGNHMGQNYGRITSVSNDKIQLVEIVPNGNGGWMKRDAALALSED